MTEAATFALHYSWYSICSEKVLLCLFEKEIAFTPHHVDLFDFAQVEAAYLAVNPMGVVPTLIHDGRPIYESTAINEYLDEIAPAPALAPAHPYARAEMRVWVQHFQDVTFPAMGLLSQVHFIAAELRRRHDPAALEALIRRKVNAERIPRQLRAVKDGIAPDEIAGARARAAATLDRMEAALGDGRKWLIGDYSLADVAAAPNLYRVQIIGEQALIEARPRVRAWYRRLIERPAFRRVYEFSPSLRS